MGASTRPRISGATATTKRARTAATTGSIALATNGEGWHNNHHADPRAAAHGHRWWEVDVTYLTICLWEKMGLAWDVVRPNESLLGRRQKTD